MSWLLLTYLLGMTLAVRGQTSCDNEAQCLESLKKILVDIDRFWFGTSYNKTCPNGQTTTVCSNPAIPKLSIASRLFDDSIPLDSHFQNTKLAKIVYSAPNASIFACGHDFQVPAVTNYQVNPLNITRVSSWSLNHKPTVTWDPLPNETLSTVIVWDVGYYFLHGLYVNCVNGSMDTGTAIVSYRGPLNPFPRPNVYLTAIFTQLQPLNVTQVRQSLQSTFQANNMGRFNVAAFLATLNNATDNTITTDPRHINLMSVMADAYSIQKQKERLLVDNCPLLASQQPILHKVFKGANLTVSLSDNTTSSLDTNLPYVTTLSVSIDVTYSTDDYWVMSCCLNYSLTRGLFKVDPFSDRTQRPGMARLRPNVQLSPTNMIPGSSFTDQVYTLFLVDVAPAADAPANATNVTVITHWLVGNIRNGDVNTGDEIAPYFGPNPFLPNSPRPYMFLLFIQPVPKLNTSFIEAMCPNGVQRCRIDLAKVLQAWNLVDLSGVTWFLSDNDGFAKMRIYTELKSRTKAEVCSDVPGYADPCPVPTPCSNLAIYTTAPSTFLVVLVAMAMTVRSLP